MIDTLNRLHEWSNLTDAELRLRCGEMTAQEIRTVRAVLAAIIGSAYLKNETNKCGAASALRCEALFGFQGYEPERWTVLKDDVYAAIESLSDAVEYAREVLDAHETNLGRSTLKNRLWAERIEGDIAKMGALRERLRKYGPLTMPTPNPSISHAASDAGRSP